jgi:hypothetical protein
LTHQRHAQLGIAKAQLDVWAHFVSRNPPCFLGSAWRNHGGIALCRLVRAWRAIEKVRRERPADYLKIIASIIPKDVHVRGRGLEDMSYEELFAAIDMLRSRKALKYRKLQQMRPTRSNTGNDRRRGSPQRGGSR